MSSASAVSASASAAAEPGAVSLTVLEARSPEEGVEEIRDLSRQRFVADLLTAPGFISWLGVVVGLRSYTITAWEGLDAPPSSARARPTPRRCAASSATEIGRGGQTGVWAPHRLNGMWARCGDCGRMVRPDVDGRCACGAELSQPRYW